MSPKVRSVTVSSKHALSSLFFGSGNNKIHLSTSRCKSKCKEMYRFHSLALWKLVFKNFLQQFITIEIDTLISLHLATPSIKHVFYLMKPLCVLVKFDALLILSNWLHALHNKVPDWRGSTQPIRWSFQILKVWFTALILTVLHGSMFLNHVT